MNTDIRFLKTDASIRNVFIELLSEKGFSKISVRDISEKAKINRSTFYAHFLDKYDLLEALENDILAKLIDLTDSFNIREIIIADKTDIEMTAFKIYVTKIVSYIHSNGKLLTLLLSENGDPYFLNKLSKSILDIWEEKNMSDYISAPINYAYAAVMGMMIQLISEWIKNDFSESEEEFAGIILRFASNILLGMIG